MILRGLFCIAFQVLLFQTAFSLQTFLTSPLVYGSAYLDSSGINVHAGWNIISLPLQAPDQSLSTLFPSAISPAWSYHGEYRKVDTLRQGVGYWMKFAEDETIMVRGSRRFDVEARLQPRWNLIGPLNIRVAIGSLEVQPPGFIVSPLYRFVAGNGYEIADTMIPGEGYWVKTSDSTAITLHSDLEFTYTPEDSTEAGEIALWYSGELRPPPAVVTRFLRDLKYLRGSYYDIVMNESTHVVSEHRFLPPWDPSWLIVSCDSTTAPLVRDGLYTGWNLLDSSLRPASCYPSAFPDRFWLKFGGMLHPVRLEEIYVQLPGVIHASANYVDFTPEVTFPLFIREDGEGFRYIFTLGWNSFFGSWWGFSTSTGIPEYLGVRNSGDPDPPWWINPYNLEIEFITWDGP